MNLAEILLQSPDKIISFLNAIPIPIHAWQIRQNELFLIDYNSAAYLETNGEIKHRLGSIASEYYRENLDLIDIIKECVENSTSISKEIKYFCNISNELKSLLFKADFIPPDLIIVQKMNSANQNLLESKLKESEEYYRLISANAKDILLLINEKYETEYVNEQALKNLLGYSKEDITGRSGLKLIHPDDFQTVILRLKKGIEETEGASEVRYRHKNGHYVWMEATGRTFHNSLGELKGIIILRDITERKSLEIKLKESEEKFRSLFEKSPYLIFLMNAEGIIIDFNQYNLNYFNGIDKSELIGRNFLDLNFIPLNLLTKLKDMHKDLLGKGFSNPVELKMDLPLENLIGTNLEWIEIQTAMVKIGDEKIIQVIIQDISERKKTEEKIRESEEMFRKFFEESQDGIILADENGIILKWNKKQEIISGVKKSDMIGCPVWDAFYLTIPEEDKTDTKYNALRSTIETFFKTGKAPWLNRFQEITTQSSDGSQRYLQQLNFPIRTRKGLLLGSIIRDITESKNIKQKLIESEKKYRIAYDQADFYKKLVTHDFSNILLVISGSSQLCSFLLEDPEKIEDVKVILDRIKEQVTRANLLIKNIQIISEIDSKEPLFESIDVYSSLTKSINYFKESYKENAIEINVDASFNQFIVSANDLLHNVFENILNNAIKYNDKPILKISIKISKIRKNNNNHVKLEFSDNGMGIMDSRKEKIFQEGHDRDKNTKGMGIGLTLVKRIIDSYNGQIWVEDRVPNDYTQGCNFIILIPAI